jgi:hypothetical protein
MQRVPLDSKAVVSAGYDAATEHLEIEFRNGRVYRYSGVPQGVFDFLIRARSKGGFVNRMIDGRYPHEEVSAPVPEQDLLAALSASVSALADESE